VPKSDTLCNKCWNHSCSRYGWSCSVSGRLNPRAAVCERFIMQCPKCARKCTKTDKGWFCPHCGWASYKIEGMPALTLD